MKRSFKRNKLSRELKPKEMVNKNRKKTRISKTSRILRMMSRLFRAQGTRRNET